MRNTFRNVVESKAESRDLENSQRETDQERFETDCRGEDHAGFGLRQERIERHVL
jgi:hypothetical protein